jgi:hypothetical protein
MLMPPTSNLIPQPLTPAIPEELALESFPRLSTSLSHVYILFYRTGMNPRPQEKYFERHGNLQNAVAYAKRYCELLNYRFVHVQKFISDFDADIKQFTTGTHSLEQT